MMTAESMLSKRPVLRFTAALLFLLHRNCYNFFQTFQDHPLMSEYPVNESAYSTLYNCSFDYEDNSSSLDQNSSASSYG